MAIQGVSFINCPEREVVNKRGYCIFCGGIPDSYITKEWVMKTGEHGIFFHYHCSKNLCYFNSQEPIRSLNGRVGLFLFKHLDKFTMIGGAVATAALIAGAILVGRIESGIALGMVFGFGVMLGSASEYGKIAAKIAIKSLIVIGVELAEIASKADRENIGLLVKMTILMMVSAGTAYGLGFLSGKVAGAVSDRVLLMGALGGGFLGIVATVALSGKAIEIICGCLGGLVIGTVGGLYTRKTIELLVGYIT